MREDILKLLIEGKEFYTDLVSNYSKTLPEEITQGASDTIKNEIPKKINEFLSFLNSSKDSPYKQITNIDEGINMFQNDEIQHSIDKTISNGNLIGITSSTNRSPSSTEILDGIKFGIETYVNTLKMQVATGKLTKGF